MYIESLDAEVEEAAATLTPGEGKRNGGEVGLGKDSQPALSKTSVFVSAASAPLRATLRARVARRGAEAAERRESRVFFRAGLNP